MTCDVKGGTILDERYDFYSIGPSGDAQRVSSRLAWITFSITWSSDMTRAYADLNGGICSGVMSISAVDHPSRETLFTASGPRWLLDGGQALATCDGQGRAASPAFQPETDRLAFMASPSSLYKEGFERTDQPWNLYEATADLHGQKLRLSGVSDPGHVVFGRGGSIYFSGKYQGTVGVWMLRPNHSRPILLFRGSADFAVSADERQMVIDEYLGDIGEDFYAIDLPVE